jgi:hypothetical protein
MKSYCTQQTEHNDDEQTQTRERNGSVGYKQNQAYCWERSLMTGISLVAETWIFRGWREV